MTPLGPAAVLAESEVRALLGACSRRAPTGVRDRALITLLWRSGLRISEALDLRPRDLKLGAAEPTVQVLKGKDENQRAVGLPSDAVDALARWLDVRASLGLARRHSAFCTLQGTRLQATQVRSMLNRRAKRAGLGDVRVHPHAFRATLAVELVREGRSIPAVRDVLGHTNIATTDAYLRRVFPKDALDATINRDPKAELHELLGGLDDAQTRTLIAALKG